MIVLGTREKKISVQRVREHSCNACNAKEALFIKISCVYLHLFFIPLFPIYKKAYSICVRCGQMLLADGLPPDVKTRAAQINAQAKIPWYLFSGAYLATLLILASVFIIDKK